MFQFCFLHVKYNSHPDPIPSAGLWRIKINASVRLSLAGIFGQRLEDTVQYERKYGLRLAPLLVEQCVDFIRERGLTEEGLFRMPGQANLVKDLQDSFDCGEKPLFDR